MRFWAFPQVSSNQKSFSFHSTPLSELIIPAQEDTSILPTGSCSAQHLCPQTRTETSEQRSTNTSYVEFRIPPYEVSETVAKSWWPADFPAVQCVTRTQHWNSADSGPHHGSATVSSVSLGKKHNISLAAGFHSHKIGNSTLPYLQSALRSFEAQGYGSVFITSIRRYIGGGSQSTLSRSITFIF